jgi:cellobiose transport system permease protein
MRSIVTVSTSERPRTFGVSRARLSNWDIRIAPYAFISPFFILFALIGVFPLIYTAWVSLNNWSLIGGAGGYVGLTNYQNVLIQPVFWQAVGNTLSIFILSVVPQLFFATLIAVALSTNLRAKTFWRMGVLLPYVAAPVAVALIFGDLFGDKYGLVNQVLEGIGLSPVGWHTDTFASHVAIATMVNFRWTGYNALILLAAIQAVPQDLFDAASLDGSGRIRTFFSVTLPQIRPTMIFVVVTATVGGLQIFDEPRLYDQLGQGGPNNQWLTLTMYIYNLGFGEGDFGRASAVAFLLLLFIVIVGLIGFAIARRIGSRDDRLLKKEEEHLVVVSGTSETAHTAGRLGESA